MKVTIGEKEFTLKYNNRALFRIEKELDKSIINIFNDSNELTKAHTAFTIVWAGIQESISFDDFSELANLVEITEILQDVKDLIAEGFDTGSKKKVVEAEA